MPAIAIDSGRAENRLLAALPSRECQRIRARCEPVELTFTEILAEPGERIRQVYFPTESYISLVAPINGRSTIEVGLIGNEGMLGLPIVLGIDISPLHAVVQGGGRALRMDSACFKEFLEGSTSLRRLLQRYLYVVIGQLAQATACTRFHVVEARLARWLLMTHDRAHADEFHVTQEFLAAMLGVRRVGITKAAIALQNNKLIRYSRGDITVLDRAGLESISCGCYAADKATYARIMG